ncbi:MAG TPA: CHAT domain-containing protein, partial [Iamia sp.]|nr:CHAT domain-containing protein [Iamia sp.]
TRLEGLLSDLAVAHVRADDAAGAVSVLEADRVWLPAPKGAAHLPDDVATAWVVTGRDGTAVVSKVAGRVSSRLLEEIDRDVLWPIVRRALAALAVGEEEADPEDTESLRLLLDVNDHIAALLPTVDRLRVVPVGGCALLPLWAGQDGDGRRLVDRCVVTVSPSAAWSAAASRPRPSGVSVGVFDSGGASLDLEPDMRTFVRWCDPATPLLEPTAEAVLGECSSETPVLHLSCHGHYDALRPLDSALELQSPLRVRDLLGWDGAPWLVNLSACETAVPNLLCSDQVISFPTAFLRAGSAHVVATLWPIRNDVATRANEEVLAALAEGQDPDEAVARAVREVRRHLVVDIGDPPDSPWTICDWAGLAHFGAAGPRGRR